MAVLNIAIDPAIKSIVNDAISAIQDAGFPVETHMDGKTVDVQMDINETTLIQIGKTLESTKVILAIQGKAPAFILRKE